MIFSQNDDVESFLPGNHYVFSKYYIFSAKAVFLKGMYPGLSFENSE
jgi:hypothetical protein